MQYQTNSLAADGVRPDSLATLPEPTSPEWTEMLAVRAQLDQDLPLLERVRLAVRLVELDRLQRGHQGLPPQPGKLRDLAGEHLGMGGRMVGHYLQALQTPEPVQAAVNTGELPLRTAQRVAALTPDQQACIATLIRRGHAPALVVASVCSQAIVPHRSDLSIAPLLCLLDWVEVEGEDASGNFDHERLQRVHTKLTRLLEGRDEAPRSQAAPETREFFADGTHLASQTEARQENRARLVRDI